MLYLTCPAAAFGYLILFVSMRCSACQKEHVMVWPNRKEFHDWFHVWTLTNTLYGPNTDVSRVIRGGSWFDSAYEVRAMLRLHIGPSDHCGYIGGRLVRTVLPTPEPLNR